MENKYDVIVIGAGSAGLVAALTLQKKGKKVLILEKENRVGGSATSFIRGRFEFEVNDEPLERFGNATKKGELYELFHRLNITPYLQIKEIDEAFHIISNETKEEFTMPSKIENFIAKMEYYVKGSKEAMITLFGLCEEMKDALNYIKEKDYKLDINDLNQKYLNFVQLAPQSFKTVLKAIKMPEKAIQILSTYWVYFGLPINEISFFQYALKLESIVKYIPCLPDKTHHEISAILEKEFKKIGGTIRRNEEVTEIILENNKISKVKSKENIFETTNVIANISPSIVYSKLINEKDVPKKAFQLYNKRTLSPQIMKIYLGLNKSAKALGLNHYTYFINHFLDSEKEIKNMEYFPHQNIVATVINHVNEYASPMNTTKMILTSTILKNQFEKNINEQNYYDKKEEWAKIIIENFEKSTNIEITPYIEEIEIATPVTFASKTNSLNGVVDGYSIKGYDNILSRILNEKEENYIKGLRFCGSYVISGLSNAYLNGEETANKLLEENEDARYNN